MYQAGWENFNRTRELVHFYALVHVQSQRNHFASSDWIFSGNNY